MNKKMVYIGIDISTIKNMKETGYQKANYKIPEKEFPVTEGNPNVKLFGTGGTIASRLDYRTGAVIPAFSPGELYGAVPELADICNLKTEKLFAVFSEMPYLPPFTIEKFHDII